MKILYVTTVGLTMCFFTEHIVMLLKGGHTVELACNDCELKIPDAYRELGLKTHTIPFSRSPLSADNIIAYRQLKRLIAEGGYDIVHTHTPIASVLVRLACREHRKHGLKVCYTAHGFHFYDGAPMLNWLIYYTVERLCSRLTDILITVNPEDYGRAAAKLHAKQTEMIPGVGADIKRFEADIDGCEVRRELGISAEAKVLIYVAELNKNKNQTSLLDVLAELTKTRTDAVLLLVGSGDMQSKIKKRAERLGLADRVIFTGFRNDVPRMLAAADVFVASSVREGFGLSLVEAMASGVPVVAYDNRGHRTVIRDGENGCLVPHGDFRQMAEKVELLLKDSDLRERLTAKAKSEADKYSSERVTELLKGIYFGNK